VLIRFIFWSLVFYFIFKVIKYVARYFSEEKSLDADNEAKIKTSHDNNGSGYKINKEDIIDAEFEDLENNKKKQSH